MFVWSVINRDAFSTYDLVEFMETCESTEPRVESSGIDDIEPEERLRDEAVAFSNCFWVC